MLSNLLILILFGIWVEQAVGFAETLLIFIIGSYFGLSLEIYLNHPPAVLGASAGIMALMGAFYVLFFRAELTFYILFWKVHIPCKWIFPCLFFADDLLQIGNQQQNGVAHWAHFGGMLVGFVLGWLVFYFQGSHDGATLAVGAIAHWQTVPQKESYFMLAQKGGHNPNLTRLNSEKSDIMSYETQLFKMAIAGSMITDNNLISINNAQDQSQKWILFREKQKEDTIINQELEDISNRSFSSGLILPRSHN